MFKVSFMVEDRKLAEALRPLAGKTFNMEVLPVESSSDISAPSHVAVARANGTSKSATDWSKFPLPKKGAKINSTELNKFIVQAGLKPKSGFYIRQMLARAGRLKKIEDRRTLPGGSVFEVM